MLLAAALALAAPGPVDPPAARYYAVYFGADSVPPKPVNSHSWATYVRAAPAADGAVAVEPVTVSFLPADLRIRPFTGAGPGANLTLEQTLAAVAELGWRVSWFGPFEIDAGRYDRAVAVAARLGSGRVRYRAVDMLHLRRSVFNCVQAIREVERAETGTFYLPWVVGERGTAEMVKQLAEKGAFRAGPPAADWVLPALGVSGTGRPAPPP